MSPLEIADENLRGLEHWRSEVLEGRVGEGAENGWVDEKRGGPALGAGAVAGLLGVAVTTLRSWDRRYGLGPSAREAGKHRRYTPEDVARLRLMRRLTYSGVPPAEAAKAALREEAVRDEGSGRRTGGGRTIAVVGGDQVARGLARAAVALDDEGILRELRARLEEFGTRAVWNEILVPLLVGVGVRWEESGGDFVEVEHLLSWCVSTALRERVAQGPASGAPVLLASAPGEEHTLALEALAAVLSEDGRAVRMLGAKVPKAALSAAVARLGPPYVVVWAQSPGSGRREDLPDLGGDRARLVLGGPGWDQAGMDDLRVASLEQALAALGDVR
jgi:DNA-binding transcriptional MerR regulator